MRLPAQTCPPGERYLRDAAPGASRFRPIWPIIWLILRANLQTRLPKRLDSHAFGLPYASILDSTI
jgi:hypothetical protein